MRKRRDVRLVAPDPRWGVVLSLVLSACSHRPPADFAPDPGLVSRIRDIRIVTPRGVGCPGETIQASYYAVLDDRSEIPFETHYDKKRPPALHVVFLRRTSPDALALENGDWEAFPDPLLTAVTGIRLSAHLKDKPSVNTLKTVPPEYSCLRHTFTLSGVAGDDGQAGGPGPDVTVRLAILKSPYYERLLVAGIEVEGGAHRYVLADAKTVPPADWLVVASSGGNGGSGANGARGAKGTDGAAGCPGAPGGAGGAGGNGEAGGAGGRGGRVTVIVPDKDPFLAGMVDARTPGGEGGSGGAGGNGGAGGKGGAATGDARRCAAGREGAAGPKGRPGAGGANGPPGSRPQVITVAADDVFSSRIPEGLAALIAEARR